MGIPSWPRIEERMRMRGYSEEQIQEAKRKWWDDYLAEKPDDVPNEVMEKAKGRFFGGAQGIAVRKEGLLSDVERGFHGSLAGAASIPANLLNLPQHLIPGKPEETGAGRFFQSAEEPFRNWEEAQMKKVMEHAEPEGVVGKAAEIAGGLPVTVASFIPFLRGAKMLGIAPKIAKSAQLAKLAKNSPALQKMLPFLAGAAQEATGFGAHSAAMAARPGATPQEVALEAAKGGATGALFAAGHALPQAATAKKALGKSAENPLIQRLLQAAGTGGAFAIPEAAMGGSAEDVAAAAAVGGVLGGVRKPIDYDMLAIQRKMVADKLKKEQEAQAVPENMVEAAQQEIPFERSAMEEGVPLEDPQAKFERLVSEEPKAELDTERGLDWIEQGREFSPPTAEMEFVDAREGTIGATVNGRLVGRAVDRGSHWEVEMSPSGETIKLRAPDRDSAMQSLRDEYSKWEQGYVEGQGLEGPDQQVRVQGVGSETLEGSKKYKEAGHSGPDVFYGERVPAEEFDKPISLADRLRILAGKKPSYEKTTGIELNQKIGQLFGRRYSKGAEALGEYHPFESAIKMNDIGSVTSFIHEVGHKADATDLNNIMERMMNQAFNTSPNRTNDPLAQVMVEASVGKFLPHDYTGGDARRIVREGFAELWSEYIWNDGRMVAEVDWGTYQGSPSYSGQTGKRPIGQEFKTAFETFLNRPENKAFKAKVDATRDMVREYRNQSEAMASSVGRAFESPVTFQERFAKGLVEFYQKGFNDVWSIERAAKWAERQLGKRLMPSNHPLYTLMEAKAASATARTWVYDGAFDIFKNPNTELAVGLKRIYKDNNIKGRKKRAEFQKYAAAKRILELKSEGRDVQAPIENPEAIIKEMQERGWADEFDKVARNFNSMGHALAKIAYDAHLIGWKEYKRITNSQHWVPLNRLFDVKNPQRATFERIRGGSGEPIQDFDISMLELAETVISRATWNNAIAKFHNLQKQVGANWGTGYIMTGNPTKDPREHPDVAEHLGWAEPWKTSALNITKKQEFLKFDDANMAVMFKKHKAGKRGDVLSEWHRFEFRDRNMYESWKGAQNVRLSPLLDTLLGKPKRMATLGYTGLNLGFSLYTNLIRDLWTADIQSKERGSGRVLMDFAKYASQLGRHALTGKETKVMENLRKAGVQITSAVGNDFRSALAHRDRVIAANSGKSETGWYVARHPIEVMRELLSFSEMLNRYGEYEMAEQKFSGQPREQMLYSRQRAADAVLNFRRMGEYSRALNEMIPFFNASLQGADKFARTFIDNPMQATLRTMTSVTAPMVFLWMMHKDDKWYQEIPDWEKMLFAHFKIGDEIIRLPLPFEYGLLFGSMPVAAMDAKYRNQPEKFKSRARFALSTLTPDFMGIAGLEPLYEYWANKDRFRNQPIVSQSLQRMDPEFQFRAATPELYKTAGKFFGKSPLLIQHLIESYTGGLSKHVTDPGLPILGTLKHRMTSRQDRPGQSVNDFYEQKERLDRTWTTARRLYMEDKKAGNAYIEAHADELGTTPGMIRLAIAKGTTPPALRRLNSVAKEMARLRRTKEDEKMTELARQALGWYQ